MMSRWFNAKMIVFALALCLAQSVFAETMDLETTNLVITKLERLLQTLDTDNSSKIPMTLRLADLYSDRARLFEMKENIKESRQDRLSAIDSYKKIFPVLNKNQKSTALSQMAHLYQLTNQKEKAEGLFRQIIVEKNKYSQEVIAQAHIGLGDIEIDRNNYKKAQGHFEAALKANSKRLNYATSRLSWCYFHLGQYEKATKTIKQLLVNNPTLDVAFRDEASHDYATFLAQREVGPEEIKSLSSVSPESSKKTNLIYFATELDRVGKKSAALAVWKIVGEEHKSNSGLEDQFKVVQIQYDLGHKNEAVEEISKIFVNWKSNGCDEKVENCDLLKARIKKLIVDWGAAEERNPSPVLIKAYGVYLAEFPEKEMSYWAAQAARKLHMNKEAIAFYRQAADLSEENKKSKIFEGSLLGEIEVATSTKDYNLINEAYSHYIQKNPTGPEASNVQYQRAHLVYDQKRFSEAAEAFHSIAMTRDGKQMDLREKAADISVESLIASKEDEKLEKWALEYASEFPKRKDEFLKIARDTVLNSEAKKINDTKVSQSDLEESLKKLSHVNIRGASDKDKLAHYKSRLAAAEKLKNLTEVQSAARGILSVRSASSADRDLAYSRLEWVAELTLKFGEAYGLLLKVKTPQLSEEERLMKLALLSELAGKNSTKYLEKYLEISRDRSTAEMVAAKLVRRSTNSMQALNKYRSRLSGEMIGQLTLEIFARTKDIRFVQDVLKNKNVRATSSGQILYRFVFLKDFQDFEKTHSAKKLMGNDKKALKKSLKDRLDLIRSLEKFAQRAIQTGDWTLELITLDSVKRQQERLASDITRLPLPSFLTKLQKEQYKILLSQQADPYSKKAMEISNKINELWAHSNIDSVFEEIKTSKEPLRTLVKKEAKLLSRFVPESQKNKFKDEYAEAVAESKKIPSRKNINEALTKVKESPFDTDKILDLKELQKKAGHDTFVAYLDGRLLQLKQGVRQ